MLPGLLRVWVQAANPPGAKAMKCGPRVTRQRMSLGGIQGEGFNVDGMTAMKDFEHCSIRFRSFVSSLSSFV